MKNRACHTTVTRCAHDVYLCPNLVEVVHSLVHKMGHSLALLAQTYVQHARPHQLAHLAIK